MLLNHLCAPWKNHFVWASPTFFKGGIGSSSGVSVAGPIDSGHLQTGEQVMLVPGGEIGVVKSKKKLSAMHSSKLTPISISYRYDERATWGAAGDSVLMTLQGLDILNFRQVPNHSTTATQATCY